MTWGEIQIESLKKMFLNNEDLKIEELDQYKGSKKYKTYLFAMPQACNEAINYIVSLLGSSDDLKPLEINPNDNYYDLSTLLDDYKKIKNVICSQNIKWKMINDDILYVDDLNDNEIKILYEMKPTVISGDTKSSVKINLKNEYVNAIPLYIAGELYKDDDLSLSTMYMNEFMTLINNFVNNSQNIVNPKIETIYSIN